MRSRLWIALLLLGTISGWSGEAPAGSSNAVPVTPEFVTKLAEEMRTNHPALAAANSRLAAAKANANAVRTWEDPMARVGAMAAEREMRQEDGDLVYGLEQRLPLFGKPRVARRAAAAETETEAASLDYQFQLLRRDLAQQLFRTALAEEVVEINAADLKWLDSMVSSAEQRYGAGEASQVSLLRLQNERARRTDRLRTDRAQLSHEQLLLNRLLNRPLSGSWPRLELPPIAGPVEYTPKLVDLAVQYEPKLKVFRQQILAADANVALVQRQRLPDVGLGVQGRNYTGDGSFRQGEFMVLFNLPWGNRGKYRSEVQRERERQRVIEHERTDYELALREEVHGLTVKIDAARREALLYRDEVVPRSEMALTSAHSGWIANRVMFLELLEARRMWLEAKLMFARALSEQYQMLSELILCCGLGDLEALQMIGAGVEPTPTPPPPPTN